MNIEDIKIGMKVVPIDKTCGTQGLNSCEEWKSVKDKINPFLCVVDIEEDINLVLSDGSKKTGSYYYASDLIPYVEENLKCHLKVGDFVRINTKPKVWSSFCIIECPLDLKYPFIGEIFEIKEGAVGLSSNIGGYGFHLSDLINTDNIKIVNGIYKAITKEDLIEGEIYKEVYSGFTQLFTSLFKYTQKSYFKYSINMDYCTFEGGKYDIEGDVFEASKEEIEIFNNKVINTNMSNERKKEILGKYAYTYFNEEIKKIEDYKVKESDLIGEIKDFPIEVVQEMVNNQIKQGNKADVNIFQENFTCVQIKNGFDWNKTKEDFKFWNRVLKYKDFDLFFKYYPKKEISSTTDLKNINSAELVGFDILNIYTYEDLVLTNPSVSKIKLTTKNKNKQLRTQLTK